MKTLKTKTWGLLLGAVFVLLAGVVLLQRGNAQPARTAAIWVDGRLERTLDLTTDGVCRIETERGWNELTVSGGKVAVTAASCPDGDCVRCGAQNSGPPITCLPNRLTIRFSADDGVDGVAK